jgi:hypothetical protein
MAHKSLGRKPSDNAALNVRLARSVLGLWTMVADCGQRGLLGRNGTLLGHDIHPSMTGRR